MQKLLLIGGGFAHLHVIQKLKDTPIDGVEITLISPSKYQYPRDMFASFTEGLFEKDQISINLEVAAEKANITYLEAAVTAVDPNQKMALTSNGEVISFDAISFDIGSLTTGTDFPGVTEHTYRIKPNYHFTDVIEQIRNRDNIVIVGGGPVGIELSLSLTAWRQKYGIQSPITLISENDLLHKNGKKVSDKTEQIVVQKGIDRFSKETVTKVTQNAVYTASNQEIEADHVLWLAGPKAPGLFTASKLPVDDKGYLRVENTLQVKEYPFIFGAGECTTMINDPYGNKTSAATLKQASVLFENIKGFFETGNGVIYKPKDQASILATGNREAMLIYKGQVFHGKWPWRIKHRQNMKWMKNFQ
ncbi:NAD(P)/FAD-dependent oxidoreductase [Texcoconibacillus texcoconensis]|uniref:NADH dehydrogenase FAD-containing subunit n=1 Tax=Texcoconibacillus texcoconensis TaxID=1095777 RepID=A0A840QRQ8_9BACI|nr:FAD-dependent oxidoreductase [Texcoconibacillus texcoconensis]MBB5174030.1 NADH dehydrogenase FAD-containing subunit [Texcoconibacillus texcoconensis]